ncbi:MCE family protein [Parasphingorhabdus pacifica]
MSTRGAFTTLRRRLLGLALLMCIVMFFGGTVAIYQKMFASSVDVVLKADSSANQLQPESDVKVRGMIIGRVEDINATDAGAELHLALDPEKADALPADVTARLLPRTLFGERFVSLKLPEQPATATLASGDVIRQDRDKASVELSTVLSNTMPVLQALHPEDLAATLNSLSQALDGRGEEMGQTISQLNSYLDRMNPALPDLKANLQEIVGVAETYEQAAPEVLQALDNLTTTSRTLVEQRENLNTLTSQLTTTSVDTTEFLQANGDSLIRLNESQRPTLDVLAKYSPAYPCFLRGMREFAPRVDEIFGAGSDEPGLHITMEVVASRGKYEPNQDEPEFKDKRGPRCYDFKNGPNPFPQYPPDGPVKDGSTAPPAARTSNEGLNPPAQSGSTAPAGTSTQSASALGPMNSPAERDFVSALLAPTMGVEPEGVPQWGSLLVGPVLRGAEVSYR